MADCWPQAPIYTLLYDRSEVTGAASPPHRVAHLLAAAPRDPPERLPPAAAAVPARRGAPPGSGPRPRRSRAAARSPTASGPDRAQCTSATATARSATCTCPEREAARGVPRCARPADGPPARPASRRWDRARVETRRPLHRQLRALAPAHRRLLRTRRFRRSTRPWTPIASRPATPEDFFLVVTRGRRHKRVEPALEAARRAGSG